MAKELSDGGIETTLIADSAAFAIIHAVNKVCVCRAAVMIHLSKIINLRVVDILIIVQLFCSCVQFFHP